MSQHRYLFVWWLSGFIIANVLLFLLYFWFAQVHYGVLIAGSSLTLPIAIRYGEIHWHGPSLPFLVEIGVFSSLIASLSFCLLLPWLRKCSFWVAGCVCLLWLAGIALLGFSMPHFSLL